MLLDAAKKALPQTLNKPPLKFFWKYEPNPRPKNCASLFTTILIAAEPSHPHHIKIQRKLAAFDPSKFHWSVAHSTESSHKAAYRNWARKRVRNAFEQELRSAGWRRDGTPKDEGSSVKPLTGALGIKLSRADVDLLMEMSYDEVKASTKLLLDKVLLRVTKLQAQNNPEGSHNRPSARSVIRHVSLDMPSVEDQGKQAPFRHKHGPASLRPASEMPGVSQKTFREAFAERPSPHVNLPGHNIDSGGLRSAKFPATVCGR